jgi:hypothetical protein
MLLGSAFSDLNLLAVLVAGIIHIAGGLIWFQPKIFGSAWAKLTGKDLTPAFPWIPAGIIGHLVMALVLALIVKLSGAQTAFDGAIIGVMTWAGFIVPLEIGELIWEKIPFKLFLIRVGNQFFGFIITGILLAVWK